MTVAKAKEEWNNFKSRWNDMSMGYIKFFFKSLIELLISAMGLTARKNHYTHARGQIFVPILCHQLTKSGHIAEYPRICYPFYHIDFIILICCSLSLFTQYICLLISRFGVRVPAGAPAIAKHYKIYINPSYQLRSILVPEFWLEGLKPYYFFRVARC